MRILFLVLAWLTPAIIAEILGWKGIWGSGSALIEYMIPIPVAGGVFHVPSFAIVCAVIWTFELYPASIRRYISLIAAGIFLGSLSLQIDFDRLNFWFFTDYSPYGSPLRLDGNTLYLFITTDAFWVWLYSIIRGNSAPFRHLVLLPLLPLIIIAFNAIEYRFGGPDFQIGGATQGKKRGTQIQLVYTSAKYDEKSFLKWLESKNYLSRPWFSPNFEHSAVIFTNSMQAVKWRAFDKIDNSNTIATICLYEEDQSIIPYNGIHDCFSDRKTFHEKISEYVADNSTGLGPDIDDWFARLHLCEGVILPEKPITDIIVTNTCRDIFFNHTRNITRFIKRYGKESKQVHAVAEAARNHERIKTDEKNEQ